MRGVCPLVPSLHVDELEEELGRLREQVEGREARNQRKRDARAKRRREGLVQKDEVEEQALLARQRIRKHGVALAFVCSLADIPLAEGRRRYLSAAAANVDAPDAEAAVASRHVGEGDAYEDSPTEHTFIQRWNRGGCVHHACASVLLSPEARHV